MELSVSRDASWAERRGPLAFRIAPATFGILALEPALIRRTPSQFREFAHFNGIVLIGAFPGMGLGVALGRHRPGLLLLALPTSGNPPIAGGDSTGGPSPA